MAAEALTGAEVTELAGFLCVLGKGLIWSCQHEEKDTCNALVVSASPKGKLNVFSQDGQPVFLQRLDFCGELRGNTPHCAL
jgi:hypothetical protein